MNITEKLDLIESKISSPEFRANLGSANEVSYFIFDYDPKDELIVREYIEKFVNKTNEKDYLDYHVSYFDLYDMLIKFLQDEEILDEVFEMEENEGFEEVLQSIQDAMGINTLEDNYIINAIKENIDEKSIVFVTGIGKVFPIIRAHKVLKNLHLIIDNVPVILFLPGKYSGLDIQLFGKLTTNYYRAFKLID